MSHQLFQSISPNKTSMKCEIPREHTCRSVWSQYSSSEFYRVFTPLLTLSSILKGKNIQLWELLNASSLCHPPALPATEQIIGKVSTKLQQLTGKNSFKLLLWRESHKLITVTDPGNIWLQTAAHWILFRRKKVGKTPKYSHSLIRWLRHLILGKYILPHHVFCLWSFTIHF